MGKIFEQTLHQKKIHKWSLGYKKKCIIIRKGNSKSSQNEIPSSTTVVNIKNQKLMIPNVGDDSAQLELARTATRM